MKPSRDPALWLGLVAAIVSLVAAFFFPLTVEQQALLNAAAVSVVGVITAFAVRRDGQAAAIVGFAQAAIALGLGFGLSLSPEQQAALMAMVTALAAAFLRTQLVAPVTAEGARQP